MSYALPIDESLRALVKCSFHTGSRAICNPAPTHTDDDWAIFTESGDEFLARAALAGWSAAVEYPSDGYVSFRRGEINLIVFVDPARYHSFEAATQIARRLNVLKKEDRVALFDAVNFRVKCDDPARLREPHE